MALEWQTAHVVLDSGVDTKSDRKIVTRLKTAENVVWTSPGAVKKRNGCTSTSFGSTAKRLSTRGSTLLVNDGHDRYVYSATEGAYYVRGHLPEAQARATPVVRDVAADTAVGDMVFCQNAATIAATAWQATVNGTTEIDYTVWDSSSDTVLAHGRLSTSNGCNGPKVVANGDYIFILYRNSANTSLLGRRWDKSAPTSLGAEFTLTTDLDNGVGSSYEVASLPSPARIQTVWQSFALTQVRVSWFSTAAAPVLQNTAVITQASIGPFGLAGGTLGTIVYVAFKCTSGTGAGSIRAFGFLVNTWTQQWATTVHAVGFTPWQVTIGETSSSTAYLVADVGTGTLFGTTIVRGINSGGVLQGVEQTYAQMSPRTRPWVDSSRVFMGVVNGSGFASTNVSHFVVDITDNFDSVLKTARPVSSCAQRLSGVATQSGSVATVSSNASGKYSYVTPGLFRLSQMSARNGLNRIDVDMVSTSRWAWAELGSMSFTAAGTAMSFDGEWDTEMGFLVAPETPTYTPGGGGALGAGPYQYCHCYAFVDPAGNVWRSAPSIAASVTMAANTSVAISNIFPVTLTKKQDHLKGSNDPPVIVETYRTLSNSTGPFYNITNLLTSIVNSPFGTTGSVTDTIADSAVQLQPQLYTGSGSLSNYQPPPCSIMAVHKGCLFVDSLDDGSIWQSKPFIVGEGISFSEALRLTLPTTERPTAMLSMDDKLVIWTLNHVFVAYGDPFDDKGNGNGLTVQPVASDTGCIDWRSVCLGVDGAYFQSPKGIYLLSRGLQLIYVGADVEKWTKGLTECTSAIMTGDRNEIRLALKTQASGFTDKTSVVVVLNYQGRSQDAPYGKWSWFDFTRNLGDPVSAVVASGSYYFADSSGQIYKESSTLYTDGPSNGIDTGFCFMTVETGVIRPGGLQGFVRCKQAQVLAEYKGTHTLLFQVVTDPDTSTAYAQVAGFPDATLLGLSHEQVGLSIVQQLGSGFQFSISDDVDVSGFTTGDSFTLTGLSLLYGVKQGLRRLPAAATG